MDSSLDRTARRLLIPSDVGPTPVQAHTPARRAFAAIVCGLWLAVTTGCAISDGVQPLDIRIVGNPVDAATLPFIPGLLRGARLLQDEGARPWLAVSMPDEIATPTTTIDPRRLDGILHVYALTPPYESYRVETDITYLPASPAGAMCSYRFARDGSFWISLRKPGATLDPEFLVGAQSPLLLCGQRTLAYWQLSRDNKVIKLLRRSSDGNVRYLELPWPAEANPMYQQGPLFFDDSERVLFIVDGDYHTQAIYIDSGEWVDLGPLYWAQTRRSLLIGMDFDGELWQFDIDSRAMQRIGYRVSTSGNVLGIHGARGEIVTCDWDGVRAVALPPIGHPSPVTAPQRVLDASPCQVNASSLPDLSDVLLYTPNGNQSDYQIRAVRLDGASPPRIMVNQWDADTVLGVCQDRAMIYTKTPPDQYGLGVSDGWLGGQRFMERGRDARFSPDCGLLYFKEHTANVRKLGDLFALDVPVDPSRDAPLPMPHRLAYNTGLIGVMPDARLLASIDLAVLGTQNRIVAFDVARGEAQALTWGMNAVTRVLFVGADMPGRREAVLEVKDGSVGGLHGLVVLDTGIPAR